MSAPPHNSDHTASVADTGSVWAWSDHALRRRRPRLGLLLRVSLLLVLVLVLLAATAPTDAQADDAIDAVDDPPAELVFVHLSDTHLATTDTNPPPRHRLIPHTKDLVHSGQWLAAAVEQINEQIQPDFIVITGDIVDAAGTIPDDIERARAILDELDCPYYVLIGNHDRRAKTDFKRIFDTPANFAFTHGSWRFIALDGSRSVLPVESLDFLRDQLEAADADEHVVVMNHYPLIVPDWLHDLARLTYGGQLVVRNADEAIDLLDQYAQVRMVLAGHIHHELDHERAGVLHLITGSLIKPPHRFRVFRLRGEKVEWELHDVRLPQSTASP